MKTVIGGIIGGAVVVVVVFGVIILMPNEIEKAQDYVKDLSPIQDIHPCQQVTIDMINLLNRYEPGTKLSDIEVYKLEKEYQELNKKEADCAKYIHQWRTPEFVEKVEIMVNND